MDRSLAPEFLNELISVGCTHLVGIPDNSSGPLFHLATQSRAIEVITTTREGEAFGLAAGLWIGGATPVVLIQNTGLLESGDALRGTLTRMGAPVLCLVTFRGYTQGPSAENNPAGSNLQTHLKDPLIDSVGTVTPNTLRAWGFPVRFLDRLDDGLDSVLERAREARFPEVFLVRKPWQLAQGEPGNAV